MNIRTRAISALLGGLMLAPVAASAGSFVILHSFTGDKDGGYPNAVIEYNEALYGTTQGDTTGKLDGTVFSVNLNEGGYKVLHDFTDKPDGSKPAGRLVFANRRLYGTTTQGGTGDGTLFSIVPSSGREKVLYRFAGGSDGISPGSLVYLNGLLYGTTSRGGAANCNCGVIFS